MANNIEKYGWEDWQLTAYLLGELEPEMMARVSAAAEKDGQLAQQLKELSRTLDDVKAVFSRDGATTGDQAALAALQASVAVAANKDVQVVKPVGTGYTWRRLVSRWENWASLAGLILIGVLLYQRPGGEILAQRSTPSPVVASHSEGVKASEASALVAADMSKDEVAKNEHVQSIANSRAQPSKQSGGRTSSSPSGVGNGVLVENKADASAGYESESGGIPSVASAPAGGMMGGMGGTSSGAGMGMGGGMGAGMMGGPASGYGGMGMGRPVDNLARGGMDSGMGSMGMEGEMGMGAMPGYGGAEGGSMGGYGASMNEGMGSLSDLEARASRFSIRQPDPRGGDRFAGFSDNEFLKVDDEPLSTFSIDVDTASYTKARQYLLEHRQLPPPASVRIEEFINYFDYEYAGPKDDKPFAASLAVTQCPWQPKHQLVRIALQAKQVETADRPKANLVFLLDVSGSMNEPNKLPLVKETMRLLTYQLTENDKVAMVVYAGAAGCVLESTYGHEQDKILSAIERLNAGGSTNGGQGIKLAYKLARENFITGGINRVILCTDGDFNVGLTSTDDLVEMVKDEAKSNVFLTVLGYGIGNTNDAMMEQIADRGNGLYGFVDSRRESQRQMVKQLAGNLMTVAKDVKIQVEFNPAKVRAYRLIGYENRRLAAEDFNNDKKDAGEIGAGHRVTALYELVTVNEPAQESPLIDGLRYQTTKRPEPVAPVKLEGAVSNELMALKLRYKQPEGTESQLLTFPLEDKSVPYAEIDKDFRWAAAMAEFGMLLRRSAHKGQATWSSLSERARGALGNPVDTSRAETLEMINTASSLFGVR